MSCAKALSVDDEQAAIAAIKRIQSIIADPAAKKKVYARHCNKCKKWHIKSTK